MPYTTIKRIKNGEQTVRYLTEEQNYIHDKRTNLIITPIRMHNQCPYYIQMDKYWHRARPNHDIQLIEIIQSFSRKEFNANDESDILKVNVIGQDMIDEHYPHRQAIVCTRANDAGDRLYNHILINDVSMNNNEGCTKEQYFHPIVKTWSDEITARYTILDYGTKKHEVYTETERAMRKRGEYVYKDDLRQRIATSARNCKNENDFFEKLNANGVKVEKRYLFSHTPYYLYELVDLSDIPENSKVPDYALQAASYTLGYDYAPENIAKRFSEYVAKNDNIDTAVTDTFDDIRQTLEQISEKNCRN